MPNDLKSRLTDLQTIQHVIGQIDTGAGFMEDRGFGWTIDLESREGIDDVRARLDNDPELRAMLPELTALLANRDRLLGFQRIPHDEVKAAIREVKLVLRKEAGP